MRGERLLILTLVLCMIGATLCIAVEACHAAPDTPAGTDAIGRWIEHGLGNLFEKLGHFLMSLIDGPSMDIWWWLRK